MKESILISNPIQAPIHVEDEILILVPLTSVRRKSICEGLGVIRRERCLYQWGMSPLAWIAYPSIFWCKAHIGF